ncbi:Uncharacterised protein [Jonesia denitrificans]|nr:Uncharacterised protein [Jonesia denitrificans]
MWWWAQHLKRLVRSLEKVSRCAVSARPPDAGRADGPALTLRTGPSAASVLRFHDAGLVVFPAPAVPVGV